MTMTVLMEQPNLLELIPDAGVTAGGPDHWDDYRSAPDDFDEGMWVLEEPFEGEWLDQATIDWARWCVSEIVPLVLIADGHQQLAELVTGLDFSDNPGSAYRIRESLAGARGLVDPHSRSAEILYAAERMMDGPTYGLIWSQECVGPQELAGKCVTMGLHRDSPHELAVSLVARGWLDDVDQLKATCRAAAQ
jgi:hypothetical protein